MLKVPEKSLYSIFTKLESFHFQAYEYVLHSNNKNWPLSIELSLWTWHFQTLLIYYSQHLYGVEEETKTQDDYKVQGDMVRKQHCQHRI